MPEIDKQIDDAKNECRHWVKLSQQRSWVYSVPCHFAANLKLKRLLAKKAETTNVQ